MLKEVLRLERVSCREQGVAQLEDFNLSVFAGEVMGLLPLNNHGLTALLRLLQYNTPLGYGYVYYREEQINTWRSAKMRNNRIGLIQSESCLVAGLTVADNIFVLRPGFKQWMVRPSVLRKQLLPFLESIDIFISADSYVGELSAFEKVVVDVLKSIVAGCRLIVLREINTNICDAELQKIYRLLRHYARQGFAFMYVDFHFEELRQVCDRVALMSNGRIIKVLDGGSAVPDAFQDHTKEYVRKVRRQISTCSPPKTRRHPVFEARELTGEFMDGLSFTVAPGECVVLQNGDSQIFGELLSILTGDAAPRGGRLLIDGGRISPKAGEIAILQELPTRSMLFNELSYLDNLCFCVDRRLPEVWLSTRVQKGIRMEYSARLGDAVFDTRVDRLTEKQKYDLVYTRVLLQKPKIMFCVQPFRRADVELRMHIWELLKQLLDKGVAIVILAVSLADSLSLADKLIRLHDGRAQEVYLKSEFSTMPISAPWLDLYKDAKAHGEGE